MSSESKEKNPARTLITILIAAAVGALLAWAGSFEGRAIQTPLGTVAIFAIATATAFLIQWIVYIPSFITKTEKFFDLTGAATFISVSFMILVTTQELDARSWILAFAVILWAARLGTFLFRRVQRAGTDSRFDTLKTQPIAFLRVWTMQGLWVSLTASAAWIAIASGQRQPLDLWAFIGIAVWLLGMVIETTADLQKQKFRANPDNKHKFMRTGIWSRSRHPNYFGEITLWVGVFLIAVPTLQGWQWIAVLSPLFVAILLLKISGIPPLEAQAEKRWGDQPDYQHYKASTPLLIPSIHAAKSRKVE